MRLTYRAAISETIRAIVAEGRPPARCAPTWADIAATVIVGGFMEGLIGPLSPLNRQQESQAEAYRHDVAVLADQIATLACASVAAAAGALRQLPRRRA